MGKSWVYFMLMLGLATVETDAWASMRTERLQCQAAFVAPHERALYQTLLDVSRRYDEFAVYFPDHLRAMFGINSVFEHALDHLADELIDPGLYSRDSLPLERRVMALHRVLNHAIIVFQSNSGF